MTARPRPLSAATRGSSTGSAYGAKMRTATWATTMSAVSHPPYPTMSAGIVPSIAEADRGVGADADREGEQEQEELRAPATPVHEPHQGVVLAHQPVLVSVGTS